jgi:hypothetical protein
MMESTAKAIWRGLRPLRLPLVRKFHAAAHEHRRTAVEEIDQRLTRQFHATYERLAAIEARSHCVESIVHERLAAIEAHSRGAESIVQELNLVLDGIVRELTRLQNQVEMLHYKLDEQSTEATLMRYSTVDESDGCVPYSDANGEHAMAVASENHRSRKSG